MKAKELTPYFFSNSSRTQQNIPWVGNLLMWILFFSSLVSILEARSPEFIAAEDVGDRIKRLTHNRIAIAEGSTLTPQDCSPIADFIANTVTMLPWTEAHISRVLESESNFTIFCTTETLMVQVFQDQRPTLRLGAFFNTNNYIVLPIDSLTSFMKKGDIYGVLAHEFMHADTFNLLRRRKCYTQNLDQALTPIYPFTQENLKAYNQALDRGDQRIQNFIQLRQMVLHNQPLDEKQKHLLNQYQKAAEGCLIPLQIYVLDDKATYKKFVAAGYKPTANETVFFENDGEAEMEVLWLGYNTQTKKYEMHARPVSSADAVVNIPGKMTDAIAFAPPELQTSEREAYTFERLTVLAIQTFYLEAWKMREEFIRLCIDDDNSGDENDYIISDGNHLKMRR